MSAQPDLFDIARTRRDIGIERVVDRADELSPGWSDAAFAALRRFCQEVDRPFLTEEVRAWAEERGLEPPHDGRAWGGVIQQARRDHLILKDGYAPAHSSNLSPKVRWRVA